MTKLAMFSWARVERLGQGDCWLWTGSINTWGYGACAWNGKSTNASRAAWESVNGPAPAGHVICHRCDRPACCNPAHLWAGTQAENLADCRAKGRQVYRTGADHHRASAKLTPDLVRQARELYATGTTQTEIGRRFGVHSSVVSRAVRGERWSHVK
jgi:hypothetical protein